MLPSDLSNPRYCLVYMAQEWTVRALQSIGPKLSALIPYHANHGFLQSFRNRQIILADEVRRRNLFPSLSCSFGRESMKGVRAGNLSKPVRTLVRWQVVIEYVFGIVVEKREIILEFC